MTDQTCPKCGANTEYWSEEARRFAANADYWRARAEKAEAERDAARKETERLRECVEVRDKWVHEPIEGQGLRCGYCGGSASRHAAETCPCVTHPLDVEG